MIGISVQNLCVDLLDRPVLRDISLDITQRRVGLIGRNGSGKTSLIRALSGLVEYRGQVTLNGVAATASRKELIGQVGLLFQNSDHQIIFPTVEEEIGFGLRALGLNKAQIDARVDQTLAEFGRTAWKTRSISTLSGGQKQLLCIMALCAVGPKIWLLDEPFTGLDIPVRHAIERILTTLDAQVIHVTHDPQSIETYDRVIWMEEGRVIADGTPDDVIPRYMSAMNETRDAFSDQ